ncbi:hypothetical protein EQ832_01505 [Pseudomonas sp. ALS1131]|nr:hypothetical protein [Pseudomonas sp. ALS1131]TRO41718.1 hypothetical protein EQ832_01505 [Pseudomonas sp. ALS1131]
MTMWARIENGTVAELTDIDPVGRYHAALVWVPCGTEVLPGWTFDGASFGVAVQAPPAPPTREQVEAARLRAYADPITGSDRYFAEAQRESLLDNTDAAEAAKAIGLARFAEIQAAHPWPEE